MSFDIGNPSYQIAQRGRAGLALGLANFLELGGNVDASRLVAGDQFLPAHDAHAVENIVAGDRLERPGWSIRSFISPADFKDEAGLHQRLEYTADQTAGNSQQCSQFKNGG